MTNRISCLQLLKTYCAQDALDRHHQQQILEFVEREPACFERSTREGHITASAWVVNQHQTHVLLTHHKKLNRWLQLGGHADGCSDVISVAKREVQEESGITDLRLLSPDIFDVDVHLIPAYKNDPEHLHFDLRFLFEAHDTIPLVVSDESNQVAWVPFEKLASYSHEPSLLRMHQKWLDDFRTHNKENV